MPSLAWAALAALLFATSLAPLLHQGLHQRLAGPEQRSPVLCHATATGTLTAAEAGHAHHACPICLTLAGLHLAKPAPAPAPAPEVVARPCPELARPLRLGLLQPLGFRHRGPPASA